MKLKGRTALVTGGSRGIGRAIAMALAEEGADVAVNYVSSEKAAREVAEAVQKLGRRSIVAQADVGDYPDTFRMAQEILKEFGHLDILVNNAGGSRPTAVDAPDEVWEESWALNFTAVRRLTQACLPAMQGQQWGRIINVSSIYGLRGAANRVNYVTSKTALIGLTRAVALETVTHGITCNAVCPGTTETPVHEATIAASMAEGLSRIDAERRLLSGKQPTGRLISADDVAALMVFLCGPESASIPSAVPTIKIGSANPITTGLKLVRDDRTQVA